MTQPDDDIEQAVALLRRTLQQQVTPEVRARHLASVQHRAAQMRFEQRRSQRAARRPRVALLAAVVGAMLIGTSSAALAASDSSVPGELLYPVKRGGEEVRLIVATPFSAQGGVQLEIAAERVHEALLVAPDRPEAVFPLITQANEAFAAAEAAGEPLVAQVAAELGVQMAHALEIAAVPQEVVQALPSSGLSDELTTLANETGTTTAQASALGGPGALGATKPSDLEIDPATGEPVLRPGLVETVTVTPTPTPSPTPAPSPTASE